MSNPKYKTKGKHIILDIWFEQWHDELLPALINGLASYCNFEIVQDMRRIFKPQGITYLAVLNESHIAIHTYPEHAYISLDIYICGTKTKSLMRAKKFIKAFYSSTIIKETIITRGVKPSYSHK